MQKQWSDLAWNQLADWSERRAESEKARKASLFTEPAPAISGADHTSLFPVIFR